MALDNVTLEIVPGEVIALVGRSGSGKSTLLSLVAGLLAPTSGELWIGTQPVHKMRMAERRTLRRGTVSIVFQEHNLLPELTALQNVRLAWDLAKPAERDRETAVRSALYAVGVEDLGDRLPRQLSGGEAQRVAVARALALRADVIVADEPTGSLDAANAAMVMKALRKAAAVGSTVVVATHDPEVIDRSTRQITLNHGRVATP